MECTLCASLPINTRTSRSHEYLRQVGTTQRIARAGKGKAAWITHHVCTVCNTGWRHVDDPYDKLAGWSTEHVPEHVFDHAS
jgi:hypothetical protein